MSAMIRTRLGACAVVLASLVAISSPAAGKVTIECKNQLHASGGVRPSEVQAKVDAQSKWAQAVVSQYGRLWADFSRATAIHYNCGPVTNGWRCVLWARPCSQVTAPSPSAATP
jgi:hypothetical protein